MKNAELFFDQFATQLAGGNIVVFLVLNQILLASKVLHANLALVLLLAMFELGVGFQVVLADRHPALHANDFLDLRTFDQF